ncbi:NADH-dependent flavin oxidoreductase [Lachnellula willkommii]|uniref:NADH-dependent flavin oxidoreductase n=1 Tax=Lachnellula willkommii TaxID=215461 RepID=A0A559MFE4_9HELO|nr:NADH-dependent flavin oxidoreductase [Lachnellula willkommii]
MGELTPQAPRWPSEHADRLRLAEPLTFEFSGRTTSNRFMKAPMTEQLCTFDENNMAENGIPTQLYQRCYEKWGRGGMGMMVTGNIVLYTNELMFKGDPIIPHDAPFSGERFDAFKAVAAVGKANGALLVAQVNHPGRYSMFVDSPVSASAITKPKVKNGPWELTITHAATQEEIRNIIAAFSHAAAYLSEAGFDGVQLHAAHGFLMASFLDASTNIRTDAYGGSLENRMRFILEVGREIRRVTPPDFILGIKINSTEFQDTGLVTDEAAVLCRELEKNSFDFVELSGGSIEKGNMFSHVRETTRKREAFFLEFAEKIAPKLSRTKVYVTGGFVTAAGMVNALDTVDGVGLARALCDDWELCRRLLDGEVDGAIRSALNQGDFWQGLMAGNRNMRLVGEYQEPKLYWTAEAVEELKLWYEAWASNRGSWKNLTIAK